MTLKRNNDRVIVAGGGPVGSLSALILAQRGIPVTVLERETGVQLDYRASTFHPPTLDLLEECGAETALLHMGLKCELSQFRDRRKGRIAEFDLTRLKNDTRHPYRLQCEQFKLVEWLYQELAKVPGAELRFGHAFTGMKQTEDEVLVEVDTREGKKTLRCDILIAADGGRSEASYSNTGGILNWSCSWSFMLASNSSVRRLGRGSSARKGICTTEPPPYVGGTLVVSNSCNLAM